MQLSELNLNRQLYKTQPQTVETLSADTVASNLAPAPSTAVASGNTVTDVNTNAEQLNGEVIAPGTIPPSTLDIANYGWTQTCSFSVTDADTVTWGSGNFTSADGVNNYSISGGNTGNMSAKTYIYLDINVSTTAYQISTVITDPIGIGKVLIAVAQNGSTAATYILVQATQIVGDNVIANTIVAEKLSVSQLSAITANMGSLTAGTITLNSSGNIKSGQTDFDTGTGWWLGYSSGAKFSIGNSSGNKMTWDGSSLAIVGTVSSSSSGSRVVLSGALAQFYNSSGTEIVDTYAASNSYLIQGIQTSSAIVLFAGSSGEVSLGRGSTQGVNWNGSDFYPFTSDSYNLGNITHKWNDIWLTGTLTVGATIDSGSDINITPAAQLTVTGACVATGSMSGLTTTASTFMRLHQMTGAQADAATSQDGDMYYRTDGSPSNVMRVKLNGTWKTVTTA